MWQQLLLEQWAWHFRALWHVCVTESLQLACCGQHITPSMAARTACCGPSVNISFTGRCWMTLVATLVGSLWLQCGGASIMAWATWPSSCPVPVHDLLSERFLGGSEPNWTSSGWFLSQHSPSRAVEGDTTATADSSSQTWVGLVRGRDTGSFAAKRILDASAVHRISALTGCAAFTASSYVPIRQQAHCVEIVRCEPFSRNAGSVACSVVSSLLLSTKGCCCDCCQLDSCRQDGVYGHSWWSIKVRSTAVKSAPGISWVI